MSDSTDLVARLRASLKFDAINGDAHERAVCASQMRQAIAAIEALRARVEQAERERDEARDAILAPGGWDERCRAAEAALATERKKHDRTARHFNAAMDRLMVNNDELNRVNAAQRAALTRAEALLRKVEWGGLYRNSRGEQVPVCPICGHAFRAGGHENGCELAAYLREREGDSYE